MQCVEKQGHLTGISKILSRKLENKQTNGYLNAKTCRGIYPPLSTASLINIS